MLAAATLVGALVLAAPAGTVGPGQAAEVEPEPTPAPTWTRPSTGAASRSLAPSPRAVRAALAPPPSSLDEQARGLGLRPRGRGYVYSGGADERFDATVARDGTVTFDLDPSVQVTVDGLCATVLCTQTRGGKQIQHPSRTSGRASSIAANILREAALGVLTGTVTYGRSTSPPIPGTRQREQELPPPAPVASVQGRYGHLPAPVAAMGDFMDRTFDLRLRLARAAAIEDLEDANARLPSRLSKLWRDAERTPAQRRAAILEIWLELDGEPNVQTDAVLSQELAARDRARRDELLAQARRLVVDSVRTHAPKGSAAAFTEAELRAFAQREQPAKAFAPYADD